MILRYIYNTDTGSKQLVGCVVKTDEGRLGYSAVHPKDRRRMSRKLARTIALGRAEKCEIGLESFFEEDDKKWLKWRGGDLWQNANVNNIPAAIVPHLAALTTILGEPSTPPGS